MAPTHWHLKIRLLTRKEGDGGKEGASRAQGVKVLDLFNVQGFIPFLIIRRAVASTNMMARVEVYVHMVCELYITICTYMHYIHEVFRSDASALPCHDRFLLLSALCMYVWLHAV